MQFYLEDTSHQMMCLFFLDNNNSLEFSSAIASKLIMDCEAQVLYYVYALADIFWKCVKENMSRISISFLRTKENICKHVFIMRTDLMLQRRKYDQMMMMMLMLTMPEMCTMQVKRKKKLYEEWMSYAYNLDNLELCADIVLSYPFFSMSLKLTW